MHTRAYCSIKKKVQLRVRVKRRTSVSYRTGLLVKTYAPSKDTSPIPSIGNENPTPARADSSLIQNTGEP